MKLSIRAKLLATAMALSAVPLIAAPLPAFAQEEVSFDAFHDALAGQGDWVYSDRWGEVWIPENVPDDFHPYYTAGRWVDTDEYGWLWASDYDWGDITFHYGRWVNDPDDGWMWIPGYVWSPGWVIWRSNDHYTGWMPMPPDDAFLNGSDISGASINISIDFNRTDDFYGYARWYGSGYNENRFASNWVFIGTANLSDRDYRAHTVGRANVVNVIHTTTNITNYTIVNNFVVNRSVDPRSVQHAGGPAVRPVQATTVLRHPTLVTSTDVGHTTQLRMRQTQPRGTGLANSAPQPSATTVQTLSTRHVERNGHPPAHLFTKQTVVHAALRPTTNATPPSPPGNTLPPNDHTAHHAGSGATPPAALTPTPPPVSPPVNHTTGHARDHTERTDHTDHVAPPGGAGNTAPLQGAQPPSHGTTTGTPPSTATDNTARHGLDRHAPPAGNAPHGSGDTTPPLAPTDTTHVRHDQAPLTPTPPPVPHTDTTRPPASAPPPPASHPVKPTKPDKDPNAPPQ